MSNFIDDLTTLPTGKADLVAVPSGQEAYYVAAAEWDSVMQAMLDLRGYSLRKSNVHSSMVDDGGKGAGTGATAVPWRTLGENIDLLILSHTVDGANAYRDPRDTPIGTIGFQNTAAPNKPAFRIGNPYVAGIGLPAWGVWGSDDTFVSGGARTWNILLSGESSGTLATILQGVRHSAYESFISNGDFKPWMRIEASAQAFTCGAGGCVALAGDVSRSGGDTVTVSTVQEHKLGVGDALWKTSDGTSGDLARFGPDSTSGSSFVVSGIVDANSFTYSDAGSNGSSTGVIQYSTETDAAFGRDGRHQSVIRVNGTTQLLCDDSGPGPAPYVPLVLRGLIKSSFWFNAGGNQQDTGLFAMVVATSGGDKTTMLPPINDVPMGGWCRVKNEGQGGSHTLTVQRDTGLDVAANILINNVNADYVMAADCWADFQHIYDGVNHFWVVYKGGPA